MGLLEDIQIAAVDGRSDLGGILRKCKLLAARLDSKPLEEWLVWESSGYPEGVKVPEYRIWPLVIRANFVGSFGRQAQDVEVPPACLPKSVREWADAFECRESISTIERMLAKSKDDKFTLNQGNLPLVIQGKVFPEYNCIQAWAEFSAANFEEVANSVRNRVLDFSLALGKEPGAEATSAGSQAAPIDPSRVSQIFNMTIYGSAQVVGSANNSAFSLNVGKDDLASLEAFMKHQGVQESDRAELRDAVRSEPTMAKGGQFGPKVSSWIAHMMRKAADGSLTVAGNLLVKAILNYYGLAD